MSELRVALAIGSLVAAFGSTALAQGIFPASGWPEGHPRLNGHGVFAAWNPAAGRFMAGGDTIEDRPNLAGWDYRINLPHVRLHPTLPSARSGAAMVGVVEDTTFATTTLSQAYHVNNAIWLFSVDASGVLQFKVLPSRRSSVSSEVENVTSLSDGWYPVGPPGISFRIEKPSAVVVGQGIGSATLHVVARATDNRLLLSSRRVDSTQITAWDSPWVEVAPRAGAHPSASAAFGSQVAIAWSVGFPARVDMRLYAPRSGVFSPISTVTNAGALPRLLWDGTALNLFYIGPFLQANLWHTLASRRRAPDGSLLAPAGSLAFRAPTQVTDTVLNAQCDVIAFNYRLHVACARFDAGATKIWYSTSTTPFGFPSAWEPASSVGLDDHIEPQLGTVGDELLVVASNPNGVLEYARKDPHVLAYEWIGGPLPVERWLEVGFEVDEMQKFFEIGLFETELLSFNRDLYLTAADGSSAPTAGLYLVNFSRAAFKHLIFRRLGIGFVWGSDGAGPLFDKPDAIAAAGGTFLLADLNGDERADLVRAVEADAGGELRVALSSGFQLGPSSQWLANFARPADVVRAGDINGDGYDDIARCFQTLDGWNVDVAFSSGSGILRQLTWRPELFAGRSTPLIGDVSGDGQDDLVLVRFGPEPAPVEVALGGRAPFGEPAAWLGEMAVIGDTPLLADVDGDRRKDLVVVSGSAPTPILVALSTGTAFSPPVQWSTILNDYRSFGVGDMNQDGREDLLGFVRGKNPHPAIATSVEVLFAESQEFSSPTTLLSTFAGEHDLPLVGDVSGDTVATYTGATERPSPPILDLVRIDPNGQVRWVAALASFPVPSGAPWERYRFFTEKGLGTAMFPEWLWTPTRCVRPAHRYLLLGASGSGDHLVTRLSVRPGSSEAHVLEELGHSIFRNCFPGVADEPHDPFGLTDDIYSIPISEGGFEADNSIGYDCIPSTTPGQLPVPKPGVPVWIDCRDPEHYFLAFMKAYRTSGELIRSSIDQVSDAARKARYQAQYSWLKNHWFNGVEFYRDPTVVDAQRETVGLACLPGRSLGPPFVEPVSGQPTSSRCPLRSPNLAGPTPVP